MTVDTSLPQTNYVTLCKFQSLIRNNSSLYSILLMKSTVLMAAYWKCTWPHFQLQSSFQEEGKSIHVLTQGQCYAEIKWLCGGTGVICASICSNQTVWVRQRCVVLWMESQSTLEIDSPTLYVVVFLIFHCLWCILVSPSWPALYLHKFM